MNDNKKELNLTHFLRKELPEIYQALNDVNLDYLDKYLSANDWVIHVYGMLPIRQRMLIPYNKVLQVDKKWQSILSETINNDKKVVIK